MFVSPGDFVRLTGDGWVEGERGTVQQVVGVDYKHNFAWVLLEEDDLCIVTEDGDYQGEKETE